MATAAPALTPADIAATVLDFSDAEFAAAPPIDVGSREVKLLDADFVGIAIAAPRSMVLQAPAGAGGSLAMALRHDGARDWDLPMLGNCLLVATELSSGHVQVVPALVPVKVLASRAGAAVKPRTAPRPPEDELEGFGAQIGWIDLTGRIEPTGRGGRWSFGLVYFDWVSNPVTVELAGPQVHAGAASAAGVRPMPAQQVPALPTYLRGRWTPAAPARGVNFELRPDERGPTPKLFLNAAFAVSPRPAMRVDSGVLSDGGQPQPVAALVPMTLLLVQANSLRPWRLELAVPVYGVPPPPDRPLEGCLALDAFAQTPGPGPGSYVGWLVLDGEVHGPQRVQLTR